MVTRFGALRSSNRPRWVDLPPRRRVIWAAALVWCALHLVGFLGAILFLSDFNRGDARSWSDLVTYLDAADAIRHHAPLYEVDSWEDEMTFHYHPVFALAFTGLAWLPFRAAGMAWFALQAGAYLAALYSWYRVAQTLSPGPAAAAYLRWLPVALVFSEWYANLAYGNTASLLLFLSGCLTLAILYERPVGGSFAALSIALMKPQWLFPLLLPVVFRRWKLLLQLIVGLAALYILVNGLYMLVIGVDYGRDTLHDYANFLTRVDDNYPWAAETGDFEDMNHSWQQIFLSYFGWQRWTLTATRLAQASLLAVIAGLTLQAWRKRITVQDHPRAVFWFAGLGYLGAMAMLAQLWELAGGIVFFLLIQTSENRRIRRVSWLFLIYVFYELQMIASMLTGWDALFLPQSLPLTMLALLLLYGLLAALGARSLAGIEEENITS